MKTKKYFIILILAANITSAQIPDNELKDLNLDWVSVSELKGSELTVVDFWATWCKPCVNSIPKMNELYKEFRNRGVEFIGINTDGPRNQSKVKPFAKAGGIEYPVLLDPDQEMVDELNVSVFPTLIIFNKKGKIVFQHEGFSHGDEKLISEELTKLLAER